MCREKWKVGDGGVRSKSQGVGMGVNGERMR